MDNTRIFIITSDYDGNQTEIDTTVSELYEKWYNDINIPTNDDTVVSCLLGKTQLYFETFGELMQTLTGE